MSYISKKKILNSGSFLNNKLSKFSIFCFALFGFCLNCLPLHAKNLDKYYVFDQDRPIILNISKSYFKSDSSIVNSNSWIFLNGKIYIINQKGQIFEYNQLSQSSKKLLDLNCVKEDKKNKVNLYKNTAIFSYKNYLVAIVNNVLFVVDPVKLEIKWHYKSNYSINPNSVIFYQNNLYFTSVNQVIQARSVENGELAWYYQNGALPKVKTNFHPVLFLKNGYLFACYDNGHVIRFNPLTGENDFEDSNKILRNKLLQYQGSMRFYAALGFDDKRARQNFTAEQIIVLTNDKPLVFDLQNYQVWSIDNLQKLQNVIYINNQIYSIYQNFLIKINPKTYKITFFQIPAKVTTSNLKTYSIVDLFGRKKDLFYLQANIYADHLNKKIFFASKQKSGFFFFDIEKERFSTF